MGEKKNSIVSANDNVVKFTFWSQCYNLDKNKNQFVQNQGQ